MASDNETAEQYCDAVGHSFEKYEGGFRCPVCRSFISELQIIRILKTANISELLEAPN